MENPSTNSNDFSKKRTPLSSGISQLPMFEDTDLAVGQNLVPLVNIKIAGKWMFIPLKMVLIGIDPYPFRSPVLGTCLCFPHSDRAIKGRREVPERSQALGGGSTPGPTAI